MRRIKTDNKSLADKINIRTLILREARIEPLRVLDLFAGEGHIWNEMRKHVAIESYVPVDKAARQMGQIRFKITPRLVQALARDHGLKRFNTIDIDCYGDPFAIWREVLYSIEQPTAVFLTRGRITYGTGRLPVTQLAKRVMGIPEWWDVPGKVELIDYADKCQLLQECPTAHITSGYLVRLTRVDYYGLLVEPK